MMSVFYSKTLSFAPECWKCILRGLDFENYLGDMPLNCPRNRCEFFPSLPYPKLKTLLNTLIRNPDSNHPTCKNRPFSSLIAAGGRFMRRNVCHSATEIPYTLDDITSVRNLVISADWTTE